MGKRYQGNEMIKRGHFTHEMMVAANLLALPKSERPLLRDIAKEAGVSERTLRYWRKEERFLQLVDEIVRNNVRSQMPEVLETVIKRAIEGSAKHAELLLKYQGLLTDRHEVVATDPRQPDLKEYDHAKIEIERELNELKALLNEDKMDKRIIDVDFEEVDG